MAPACFRIGTQGWYFLSPHPAKAVASAGGTKDSLGTFWAVQGSPLLPSPGAAAVSQPVGLIWVIKFPSEHTNSHSNAVLSEISLNV